MSAMRHVGALAGFELRGVGRGRWILVGGSVVALAAIGAVVAGLRSFATLGLAGAGAATDGLVNVALLLPPLIGLLLGAGTVARDRERGMLALLAGQPLPRGALPIASFAGSVLAVWAVVAFGFGAGLLVMSTVATGRDVAVLAGVLAVSLAATAAAVALGVAISALARTHHQATATAAALWLLLALGLDLLLAGVAPGLRLGPAGLLVAVVVNPLEAARILATIVLDGPVTLGPLGAYLDATFGRGGTITLLASVLGWWTAAPLALACWATQRRDA